MAPLKAVTTSSGVSSVIDALAAQARVNAWVRRPVGSPGIRPAASPPSTMRWCSASFSRSAATTNAPAHGSGCMSVRPSLDSRNPESCTTSECLAPIVTRIGPSGTVATTREPVGGASTRTSPPYRTNTSRVVDKGTTPTVPLSGEPIGVTSCGVTEATSSRSTRALELCTRLAAR